VWGITTRAMMAATAKATTTMTNTKKWTHGPWVPHVGFWGISILFKVIFPSYSKWLAYDNITTFLLCVCYPLCSTISLIHRNRQHQETAISDDKVETELQIERQYWIEYWSVGFTGVQFLHSIIPLFPSIQHMGQYQYQYLPVVMSEIKFFFFLWIFLMENLLVSYQKYLGVREEENWKKFVPLTLITKAVGPKLMTIQMAISEQISKETWQRVIHSKAQRFLEVFVLLQFLNEESKDYLLQLLDEGRSVLLLSVFMVLPSSISQFGVLYVQFIYPGARSLVARGNTVEVLSLKYWVLNSLLSSFLYISWWTWWWIPFSTQIIFAIRCFYTFPSTITHYYSIIETELITFGILSGKSELALKETKTVQVLRGVLKRLPRDKEAQSFQFEVSDDDVSSDDSSSSSDDSSIDSSDATEKERRRRRRRRRRKKRAKKKMLQKKSNSTAPPALLADTVQTKKNDENVEIMKQNEIETTKNVNERATDLIEKYKKSYLKESVADKNDTANNDDDQGLVDVEIDDESVTADKIDIAKDDRNTMPRNPLSLVDDNVPPTISVTDLSTKNRIICTENEERDDGRDFATGSPSNESDIRHPISMSMDSTGSERTLLPSISMTAGSSHSTTMDTCFESKSKTEQNSSVTKNRSFFVENKTKHEMKEATLNSLPDETDVPISSSTDSDNLSELPTQYSDISMTAVGSSDSSRVPSKSGSNLDISPPTVNSTDEVEVQVVEQSITARKPSRISIPSTYGRMAGSLLTSINSEEKDLRPTSMPKVTIPSPNSNDDDDGSLYLSDIDSVESFEALRKFNSKKLSAYKLTKSTTTTMTDVHQRDTSPRRSTRLSKLRREGQEHRSHRQTATSATISSCKKSIAVSPKRKSKKAITSSSEGSEPISASASPKRQMTMSVSPRRKSKKASPDKKSKTPNSSYTEREIPKSEEDSIDEKVKRSEKSTSASPTKTRNKNEHRKIPNSRKKKKGPSMFGVLNRN
jgi:hypothetical protein